MGPAAAFAWELRRRHRWGLTALLVYFAALVAVRLLVLGPARRFALEEAWAFALAVIVPLASTFTYLLAVFSFGLRGDLASRESIFPPRRFTLPVTSTALAGWPMLYGASAMALLWLATRALALWPAGARVPILWPALFAAVFLAWTQALTWMPYPRRGLRVLITVLWLAVIGFAALLALHLEAPESTMLILLAPHLPLAFLAARLAVGRARCGDGMNPRRSLPLAGPGAPTSVRKMGMLSPRRRAPFPSPHRAQAWFENRLHGRSLPILVALLLPFELSLFFFFRETPAIVLTTLAAVLLTPPFLASFVAASVAKPSPGSASHDLSPWIATRPLTTGALLSAKLGATVRSTLTAWMLVLLAAPAALVASGTTSIVADAAGRVVEIAGVPRALGMGLLVLLGLLGSTWRQLVQSLWFRLSGRPWLVRGSVFFTLAALTVMVFLAHWALRHKGALAALWNALPGILAVAVGLKVLAAAWVALHLHRSRWFSDRALLLGALSWNVAVLTLYGLLLWLLPAMIFRRHLLALMAILAVPLVRLSATPLALSWNRHR